MFVVRVGLFLTLTSTFLVPALSQQQDQKLKRPSKTQPSLTREAEALRLSAISTLHSLAQSANEIDSIPERVRVLAEIGDAFWLVEPEHARTVLVRSFKEIDKLSVNATGHAEKIATQKRTLRRVVLARIAKHEPSLASQLVHDLPDEIPTADERAMQQQGVATPNADALLSLAENLLASDIRRAAAMAGYSLQYGLSQRLRLFLIRLRAKDSVAADGLVGAAIGEASAQHPGRLFDVMVLWDYAYEPPDFYFNGIVWTRENNLPQQNTSKALKRSVLGFAVTAIVENLQTLSVANDGVTQDRNLAQAHLASLHSVIQQLLPSVQADWPQGTPDLQQALVRVEQELRTAGQSIPPRPPAEDAELGLTEIDKLIEKAAAASQGESRDSLYLAAALKLLQRSQYEKGKDVATKIDDVERRTMILEPLNFRLVGEFIKKKSLQDALNVANQLKTPELRIASLARIGRAFIETGDARTGLQTLSTAQSMVSKADPTIEVAAATLRVAAAVSKEDPIRSSELITAAIQIVNKVKLEETPWSLMASAGAEDALGLSWKNATGGGLKSVKATYPRNGGLADLLSKQDFNQAISLARTVNIKALSLAAQAAVCRNVIQSTESKAITTRSN